MFSLLAVMAVALPTSQDIADALPDPDISCVWMTNGVCICTDWQQTVRDLSCGETGVAAEVVCSYNVANTDGNKQGRNNAEQRMDVFRTVDGKLKFQRFYSPPKDIDWFG